MPISTPNGDSVLIMLSAIAVSPAAVRNQTEELTGGRLPK
jgi:hypothetical protein